MRLNLCILRPTRVHNRKGKWIGLVVFAQLTAESAYTLQWAPLSTRIAASHGDLDRPCNTWCFRPVRAHNPNGTSIGSAVFAQMTAECLHTLQWFACFPSKMPLPMLASGPYVIRGSLGPPKYGKYLIVSAVFAGLTSVTHWQSDRKTDGQTALLGAMRRIMRNYVGYGEATQSFHVSTNNFATIMSPSVRSKHLIKYLV